MDYTTSASAKPILGNSADKATVSNKPKITQKKCEAIALEQGSKKVEKSINTDLLLCATAVSAVTQKMSTDMPITKKGKTANILAKVVRIVTLTPVLCLALLIILALNMPQVFIQPIHFWFSVLFLTAFPVLAYPIHYLVPKLRKTRRKGQRTMAIVMANGGYILGLIFAYVFQMSSALKMVYLTYVLSAGIIAFCAFVLKFNASAHFCGLTGPIVMIAYLVAPIYLVALVLLPALIWGTLRLRRHTIAQMIAGSFVPIAAMIVSYFIAFGF